MSHITDKENTNSFYEINYLYRDYGKEKFGFENCNNFSQFVKLFNETEGEDDIFLVESIDDLIQFTKNQEIYEVDNEIIQFLLEKLKSADADVQTVTKIALERAYAYSNQWEKAAKYTVMNIENYEPPSIKKLQERCKDLGIKEGSKDYYKQYVYMFTECEDLKEMLRDEESYLFDELKYNNVAFDLNKVYNTISSHIRDKCQKSNIKDENIIKALIVYVCRQEAKCIEENSKYDAWEFTENCINKAGIEWKYLSNKDNENYGFERKTCFIRIYKCDDCLEFINSYSVCDRMEKIIRTKLKMQAVSHRDSCNDTYLYFHKKN